MATILGVLFTAIGFYVVGYIVGFNHSTRNYNRQLAELLKKVESLSVELPERNPGS